MFIYNGLYISGLCGDSCRVSQVSDLSQTDVYPIRRNHFCVFKEERESDERLTLLQFFSLHDSSDTFSFQEGCNFQEKCKTPHTYTERDNRFFGGVILKFIPKHSISHV